MTTEVFGLSTAVLSHLWSTTSDVSQRHPSTRCARHPFFTDSYTLGRPERAASTRGVRLRLPVLRRARRDNQRWSTWYDVEPLCRGPEPRPDWVITDAAAVDTELGVLKTGKEADVFLLERAVEDGRRS